MDTEENKSKKYIRTFAGDMEILNSGGTPELRPLVDSKILQIPQEERPINLPPAPSAIPIQPTVTPVAPVTPAPTPVAPITPAPTVVTAAPISTPIPTAIPTPAPAERLIEASPITANTIPIPTPKASPIWETILPPKKEGPTPIETYEGDFSDRLKKVNASTATVLAAEQDAGPKKYEQAPDSSKNNAGYIFAGVALLIVGIFGVYFAYTSFTNSSAPVTIIQNVSSPIFVDERESISGTGTALVQAIEQSVTHPLASGAVRLLYIENTSTTNNSIFSELETLAPDILLRNIKADGSMAGIVNVGGSQSPFFILSVASYSNTFSGMISWEPLMAHDLRMLFPPYKAPAQTTSSTQAEIPAPVATTTVPKAAVETSKTVATTTPIVKKQSVSAIAAGFYDEVINNHDARVFRDSAGRSVLLYGYWNQTTLIIARDPSAFTEILQRLATSRAK